MLHPYKYDVHLGLQLQPVSGPELQYTRQGGKRVFAKGASEVGQFLRTFIG